MTSDTGLDRLNSVSSEDAESAFVECCGSVQWARKMAAARPFRTRGPLIETAHSTWRDLGRAEWLAAFATHPRIGEHTPGDWAAQEQAGVAFASNDIRERLFEANEAYEQRFGHIFIVCATGRSADDILALMRGRLHNDADAELTVASEEQLKIALIRLEKLLDA